MTAPRLATHIRIAAMHRLAEGQGAFLTVYRRGDPTSGTLIIVYRIRGGLPQIMEQFPALDGSQTWAASGPQNIENEGQISEWLQRRQDRDPDMWIVELDIAQDAQLDAILGQQG